MADTVTTNYNLVKPEVGQSTDTWGDKLNANMDKIDTAVKGLADGTGTLTAGAVRHDITQTIDTAGKARARSNMGVQEIWNGTQAAYDAIVTKNANTLYFIS